MSFTPFSQVSLERSTCHSQTYHPEPASGRLCCPLRILARHQSSEGTSTRQEKGEEHQALKVNPTGRDHRDRADYAIQESGQRIEGDCSGDPGYCIQCRLSSGWTKSEGDQRRYKVGGDRQLVTLVSNFGKFTNGSVQFLTSRC
jgi:hypothetical protein